MAGLEITKFDDRWGVTWESVGFYPEEIEIKMGMQINRFPKMGVSWMVFTVENPSYKLMFIINTIYICYI